MRELKIPFPTIETYEKTRLIQIPDKPQIMYTNPGDTSIYVRNAKGILANDFVILSAFESEDAEIVKVSDVDQQGHLIDLATTIYQGHALGSSGLPGAVVIKTPYNQVKVYKGTLADMSDHTLIATVDLRPDAAYTYYHDALGLSTNYYSYAYYNSHGNGTTGTQILYTENDYDAVLTVENLVNNFMFGLDLTDDDGNQFPRGMLEFAIKAAVDSLEKTLCVRIKPTQILNEMQDYYRSDYLDFAFVQLNEYPIVSVERVAIKYPTAQTEIEFPTEWYQINRVHGQVHLIPTSGSLSQILMGRGGDYLTFVWKGWDWMPNMWRINYTAGFPVGQIPNDLIAVVGKMACFYPLNIAGDLVGGIAIASKSIGIDGLSQSINTTSSAENAGYSARLRQYERELKIEIPRLQTFYKGIKLAVC